jgi:hypothetical protein
MTFNSAMQFDWEKLIEELADRGGQAEDLRALRQR